MIDPYAIVRRLTGHELISTRDAFLLTKAIDDLIDETNGKTDRIAALSAEVEKWEKHATTGDQVLGRTRAKLATAEAQVAALTKALDAAEPILESELDQRRACAVGDDDPYVKPVIEALADIRAARSWQASRGEGA